eukprot:GILJ01014582.1.p1 GENE.GILJ01014582.1~~GILJ01014582.1.p1  ORF type:complete len:1405 (+),score=239.33 GILJ01014582.1:69-4283(+)
MEDKSNANADGISNNSCIEYCLRSSFRSLSIKSRRIWPLVDKREEQSFHEYGEQLGGPVLVSWLDLSQLGPKNAPDELLRTGVLHLPPSGFFFSTGAVKLSQELSMEGASGYLLMCKLAVGRPFWKDESISLSIHTEPTTTSPSKSSAIPKGFSSLCLLREWNTYDFEIAPHDGSSNICFQYDYAIRDPTQVLPFAIVEVVNEPIPAPTISVGLCESCGEAQSQWFCTADNAQLCSPCDAEIHSVNKLARKHVRRPVTHSSAAFGTCPLHNGQYWTLYCLDCSMMLCGHCKLRGSHSHLEQMNHKLIPIEEAYELICEFAYKGDPKIEERRDQIVDRLEKVNRSMNQLYSNFVTVEEEIYSQLQESLLTMVAHHESSARSLQADKRQVMTNLFKSELAEAFYRHLLVVLSPVESLPYIEAHMKYRTELLSEPEILVTDSPQHELLQVVGEVLVYSDPVAYLESQQPQTTQQTVDLSRVDSTAEPRRKTAADIYQRTMAQGEIQRSETSERPIVKPLQPVENSLTRLLSSPVKSSRRSSIIESTQEAVHVAEPAHGVMDLQHSSPRLDHRRVDSDFNFTFSGSELRVSKGILTQVPHDSTTESSHYRNNHNETIDRPLSTNELKSNLNISSPVSDSNHFRFDSSPTATPSPILFANNGHQRPYKFDVSSYLPRSLQSSDQDGIDSTLDIINSAKVQEVQTQLHQELELARNSIHKQINTNIAHAHIQALDQHPSQVKMPRTQLTPTLSSSQTPSSLSNSNSKQLLSGPTASSALSTMSSHNHPNQSSFHPPTQSSPHPVFSLVPQYVPQRLSGRVTAPVSISPTPTRTVSINSTTRTIHSVPSRISPVVHSVRKSRSKTPPSSRRAETAPPVDLQSSKMSDSSMNRSRESISQYLQQLQASSTPVEVKPVATVVSAVETNGSVLEGEGKNGYMLKQGGSSWKQFFFHLKENTLRYYGGANFGTLKGTICLQNALIQCDPQNSSHLKIITPEREHDLIATNETEARSWITAFRQSLRSMHSKTVTAQAASFVRSPPRPTTGYGGSKALDMNQHVNQFLSPSGSLSTKSTGSAVTSESDVELLREFGDLLRAPGLTLVFELAQMSSHNELDSLSKQLLIAFLAEKQCLRLLNGFVRKEVDSTLNPATLFRDSNMASRMVSSFCQLVAGVYAKNLFDSLLKSILSLHKSGLEVDPAKLTAFDNLDNNVSALSSVAQMFLDRILQSIQCLPVQLIALLKLLYQVIHSKFPTVSLANITGLIFLRFYCPSILAPTDNSPTKKNAAKSKERRRCVTLVTKCLQAAANGVEFGPKEGFMIRLNSFVVNNSERISNFVAQLLSSSVDVADVDSSPLSTEVEQQALKNLLHFCAQKFDTLQQHLQTTEDGKPCWERLSKILYAAVRSGSLMSVP